MTFLKKFLKIQSVFLIELIESLEKPNCFFLSNLFIFIYLIYFSNQSLLNGFLHFRQCLHHNNILARKQVKNKCSKYEVHVTSVTIYNDNCPLMWSAEIRDPVTVLFNYVRKGSCSISCFFIIIQILTLVCQINWIAAKSPRTHENFLCLGCRAWLSLVFSIIYRVVLMYVYF